MALYQFCCLVMVICFARIGSEKAVKRVWAISTVAVFVTLGMEVL